MRTEWVCDVCAQRFPTEKEATDHEELHGYAFVMIIDGKKYISRHAYIWSGPNRTLRRLPRNVVGEEAMREAEKYLIIDRDDRFAIMRHPIGAANLPQVKAPDPEPEEKK